ncbi:MAG TPA: PAS domain S-box protein [Chloroflexota bacterium]|nr:PAS domain S-box protein [Chloroflexota bacterium]
MPIRTESLSKPSQCADTLHAREQQLMLALQASRMVAWEWDPIRDIITTTENLPQIYGVTAVELAEQAFALVHPDDAARHRATVDRAVADGTSYCSEFRIVRPDNGAVVWLEERGTPVLDETAKVQKLIAVVMDITARKQTEDALRHSEELFRTMVSAANEGIWFIDHNARTVYANDRMAEMLGYTPESFRQVTVSDCAFPGDESLHQERIRQNLAGDVAQFDTRFRRQDGSELLVLCCTSPVRDASGAIIGALGMFTDITERSQAEEERREVLAREHQARVDAEVAQGRLSLLSEVSALLASSLDEETTLRSLARSVVPSLADWCEIHLVDDDGTVRQITITHPDPTKLELAHEIEQRYPVDAEAPAGVGKVLRTAQAELVPDASDELLATLTSDVELLRLLQQIGVTSWMVVPLAARGHLMGAITLATAESGRHYGPDDLVLGEDLARRAALAIDNARLYREAHRIAAESSAILSQMTDGVILCATDGTVTFMNEAAHRLYGSEFVGKSLTDYPGDTSVLDTRGEPYLADALPLHRALVLGETTLGAEARLHLGDGREVIVQRSATPVIGEDGTRLGAVLTVRDVTAQRAVDQQKEEFLAAAAHDLKTPVTSLKGLAQLLQRRLNQDGDASVEQLRDGLARMEQNANRMTSLINELLDLSRLQTGEGLELSLHRTDLVALVSQGVAEYRQGPRSREITFHSAVPKLVGTWDTDRLERVVANLLSNAVKYSGSKTPITVTVSTETGEGAEWAILTVQDHGIGIPEDDVAHIFERFRRGHNVGHHRLGTGIGLSGAKQIVEHHGGRIEVVSKEGVGSTFTVRLPVTPADGAGEREPARDG